MEIERKFLIDEPPPPGSLPEPAVILQGYVDTGATAVEVRLRRQGDRFFLTIKTGFGLARAESDVELTAKQFEELWPCTEGRRLEKDRYEIQNRHHLIELDIFHGVLEGLVVAEVEFFSVEESLQFEPPNWFGREVTEDSRYKNRMLALMGKP